MPSASAQLDEASKRFLTDNLWRAGCLVWKLHSSQREVYEGIRKAPSSRYVMEIARRWGKTFLLATLALEECIRTPKSRVVYGAPTLKHLQEFILPTFEALIEDAPPDVKPVWNQAAGHFTFPNGSWVHLFGADDRRKANRGRGPEAKLAIFDEAGFCPVLRHVLKSVFRPSLLRSGGRVLLGSTPAEEPDHEFTAIAERAEERGTYSRKTVWDNPQLSREHVEAFIEEDAKDEGLTAEQYQLTDEFRREYMAERVINRLLTVIPEWEDMRATCIVEVKRPAVFDAMVVVDWGGADPHGVLFGYWHFELAKWVIEDELLMRDGENSEALVAAMRQKETELWGVRKWDGMLRALQLNEERELLGALPDWLLARVEKEAPHQPYARWCDNNNLILARDFAELHGMAIIPTRKDHLEMQVNALRLMIGSGQVLVHPRCVHLDRHLRSTTWANHKRKTFRRTEGGEHGDLVACGIYGARNLSRRNPHPKEPVGMSMARRAQYELEQRNRNTLLPSNNPLSSILRGRGRV